MYCSCSVHVRREGEIFFMPLFMPYALLICTLMIFIWEASRAVILGKQDELSEGVRLDEGYNSDTKLHE